jgi:hypothetical protein
MATRRQKAVIAELVADSGIPMSKALRRAGYSEAIAHNPQVVTRSPAFAELAEMYLKTPDILAVAADGLHATKKRAEIIDRDAKGNPIYQYVDDTDHYARHMYLQTALKIRNLAQSDEQPIGDINIQIINYAPPKASSKQVENSA